MAGLSGAALLDVWERATGLGHPERAVLYAAATMPGRSIEEVNALPIGRRDWAVAGLRTATFGRRLSATAACPGCGEVLEFELDVAALLPPPAGEPPGPVHVERDGWRVTCRLLTTADLLAITGHGDEAAALVARCIEVEVSGPADGVPSDAVPPRLIEAIGEALAAADPGADIRLDLSCVACGHAWFAPFDIVTVLDRELDMWARSTLQEVGSLARAFGWTEAEVLGLSTARRRRYLELASA
jgi:hypothetical protein